MENSNPIKTERQKIGLKQTELAKIIGVSKQAVCDWEKGRRIPNRKHIKKLAETFETSIDYLIRQICDEPSSA
jgi:transcriptional regulator with XRE-family HTH domain